MDGSSSSQDGPGGNKGRVDVSLNSQNISNIYYQMDRLIAYATLPSYISFRVKDEGMNSLTSLPLNANAFEVVRYS